MKRCRLLTISSNALNSTAFLQSQPLHHLDDFMQTTKKLTVIATAASIALVSSVVFAQAKKPTAPAAAPAAAPKATSSGSDLYSQSQLDLIVKERVAQGQPDSPELREFLKQELINRELLLRAAKAKGLDRDANLRTQMQVAADTLLIRSYVTGVLSASPVGDDVLKKEYDAIKSGLGDKEYRARHILVEKKEEADALVKQLQGGAKFEDLAKASSKDPGSKENGGDLDWAVPSNYVKPFSDAMVALEKGKYTPQPVQSPFGFHIIKLEDVREAKAPPYEEVKPQLAQRLQGKVLEDHVIELRAKAGIK
jgi:peptidyl-prolyl cis-trans isomerase C